MPGWKQNRAVCWKQNRACWAVGSFLQPKVSRALVPVQAENQGRIAGLEKHPVPGLEREQGPDEAGQEAHLNHEHPHPPNYSLVSPLLRVSSPLDASILDQDRKFVGLLAIVFPTTPSSFTTLSTDKRFLQIFPFILYRIPQTTP